MSYLRIFFCCCLFFVANMSNVQAAGIFNFHDEAQQIYNKIFELRLQEAQTMIAHLKQTEPNNLIAYHLENYVDFFTIYVSEDVKVYQRLKPNRERRLELIEAGNPSSPYYLYTQAEIRLHWALIKFRFEDYLSAFTDINRAHKLLLRNQELFPNFLGNKKDLGILHAAVGTVPDSYRWALELMSSLEGTVGQGKKEIEAVLAAGKQQNFPFQQETQVLYTFLLLHLDGRPEAAWSALEKAQLQPDKTPLHAFVMANIAMRTGRNEQAVKWLEAAPQGGAFFSFPYLEYMLGVAKLRRLDTSARKHLNTFLQLTRGQHYVKETYQKLAWAALLDGQTDDYRSYMRQAANKGTTAVGGDKNAEQEALAGIVPHQTLLKGRLLYDGGYYQRAYDLFTQYSERSFSNFLFRLEYTYRKGRILHGLKRYDQAIMQYGRTIELGKDNAAFYACNAALQAGLIEEKRSHVVSAKRYFNLCLSLRPEDYRTGLHQQAKAGLSRLE